MYLLWGYDPIGINRGITNLNVMAVAVRITQRLIPTIPVGGCCSHEYENGHQQENRKHESFHKENQSYFSFLERLCLKGENANGVRVTPVRMAVDILEPSNSFPSHRNSESSRTEQDRQLREQ
jgi:hypothetical protein